MRYFAIVFVLSLSLLGVGSVSAGSLQWNLVGVNPTGYVNLTTTPDILGSYNGDEFYSGVLNWVDSSSVSHYTYCIDVSSVINFSSSNPPLYDFNSESVSALTPSATYTTAVVNGIQNLWDSNFSGFENTLTGSSAGSNNAEATELQIALWDIIYNAGSTANVGVPLIFSNDSFSGSNLAAALSLANAAYDAGTPSPTSIKPGLTALQAINTNLGSEDPGQNQIYLTLGGGSGPPPSVPLPGFLSSTLVLLATAGSFRVISK